MEVEKVKCWKSKKRPEWLNPGKVIAVYVKFLLEKSPEELKMVGSSQEYPNKKL